MNPVLQDFIVDLDRMKRLLALAEQLSSFRACALSADDFRDQLTGETAVRLHASTKEAHSDMPILTGVLLLYLAGRFENFVKEIFEDLCDTLVGRCDKYIYLPKMMRENLVKFTAEVVSSPRKYGHAENGVRAFISTLADNLNGLPLAGVNSKCLSITVENMWPDTLNEMFLRIGAKGIWDRLGQQASVQLFFQTGDAPKAASEARALLNAFMELRNKIAHPSGALEWPALGLAHKYTDFCRTVAEAIADICSVWAATLPLQVPETQPDQGNGEPVCV